MFYCNTTKSYPVLSQKLECHGELDIRVIWREMKFVHITVISEAMNDENQNTKEISVTIETEYQNVEYLYISNLTQKGYICCQIRFVFSYFYKLFE